MKTVFILFFSLLTSIGYSKQVFIPGYIITNEQDTIRGKIQRFTDEYRHSTTCIFQRGEEPIEEFVPEDILGYRFEEGRYFITKTIEFQDDQKTIFLEFLLKGTVNLYYYPTGGEEFYYVERDDELLLLESTKKHYIYDTHQEEWVSTDYPHGAARVREKKEYIQVLKNLLEETPELHQEIESMAFGKQGLVKLGHAYHDKVCDDWECIVYKRKFKIAFVTGIGSSYQSQIMYREKQYKRQGFSPYDTHQDSYISILGHLGIVFPVRFGDMEVGLSLAQGNFQSKEMRNDLVLFRDMEVGLSLAQGNFQSKEWRNGYVEDFLEGIVTSGAFDVTYYLGHKKLKPFVGLALHSVSLKPKYAIRIISTPENYKLIHENKGFGNVIYYACMELGVSYEIVKNLSIQGSAYIFPFGLKEFSGGQIQLSYRISLSK